MGLSSVFEKGTVKLFRAVVRLYKELWYSIPLIMARLNTHTLNTGPTTVLSSSVNKFDVAHTRSTDPTTNVHSEISSPTVLRR